MIFLPIVCLHVLYQYYYIICISLLHIHIYIYAVYLTYNDRLLSFSPTNLTQPAAFLGMRSFSSAACLWLHDGILATVRTPGSL